jgi:hypothetical protein
MRIALASLLLVLAVSPAGADVAKKPVPAKPATPAVTQPAAGGDATVMSGNDCERARKQNKTCVLSIEGIDLEGNAMGPDGMRVDLLGFSAIGSLITLRREFLQEILRSAEDL